MNEHWFEFDQEAGVIKVRPEGKRELLIREADVQVSFFSTGSGGQNVNRHMNGVRLTYTIPEGYLMFQKTRELVTRSIAQRSQPSNFKMAFQQLADKVQNYFYIPPFRQKTRTPRRAKERRISDKKFRSQKKGTRKRVDY